LAGPVARDRSAILPPQHEDWQRRSKSVQNNVIERKELRLTFTEQKHSRSVIPIVLVGNVGLITLGLSATIGNRSLAHFKKETPCHL
jgi:hypothetical protein